MYKWRQDHTCSSPVYYNQVNTHKNTPPKKKIRHPLKKKKKIEDTLESLEKIIRSSKVITLVGDYNCSEVGWETFESGGENCSGIRLLRLTMSTRMGYW